MPRSRATAAAEVGLIVSATARTPRTRPSQPANTAVCPSASASAARAASSAGTGRAHVVSSQPARPTTTAREFTTPRTPSP